MRTIGRWATSVASLLRLTRRADTLVLICIALLVGVVTAGIVAAERAVDVAEEDSLEQALANAPAETTRLVVEVADVFTPSGPRDPLVVPRRKIDGAETSIDPLVSSVYVDPRLVLDAPRLTVRAVDGEPTASPTALVLRVQPDLEAHASLVDGAEPAGVEAVDGVDVVEVSVSTGAAGELGWNVGSELLVTPTTDDPLFRGFETLPDPFVIRVAGLLELDDPAEPFWFGDDRLHRVIVEDTGLGADLTVHAVIPEAQLPIVLATLGGQAALRVEERRDLDPARIEMSNVAAVERAVRTTEAGTTPTAAFGSPAVRLGLGDVLAAETVRRGTARDAIRVAAVGVVAAAIAAFLQLQQVSADRRRPWWVQVRARGAAPGAMVAGSMVATTVTVAAGVLVGALVGRSVVGGASSSPVGVVVAFAAMLVVADLVLQIGDAGSVLGRSDAASSSRWRRAGVIVVVVLAIASVISLRRRGIATGGEGNDLLVVLPLALVPIAVALVAVTVLSGLRRGRTIGGLDVGVGRLVGLRRAAEMRSASSLVVAVAVAACVATVSAAIAWSLRDSSTGDAGGPLGVVARSSFAAAAVAAWSLGVAGVGIATVITMRRRRRDAELLSALGAQRFEFRRAVIAELAPLVGVGLVVAAVAAWITVTALERRLDLDALRGSVVGSLAGTDDATGVARRDAAPRVVGATFAVMGSLFVVAVGVMRLAVARTERTVAVVGEAGPG